ncbi:MAG TPA: ShlB/FhaC/HecB family hemolysin secretion/activation protein [Gemmatimonadaceae bacterium]|nr:ShlB/FhaC/HecB family hemolysin secretion/activation protein [Gemmatimonadaceae bacterium]
MVSVLTVALLTFQSVSVSVGGAQDSIRRDSIRAARSARMDSIRESREKRAIRRIPVTSAHLATAFRDNAARSLLDQARITRVRHDSSLVSYDATAYMRISAGLGLRRFGRDRLLFRQESVGRVRWHRDKGAWVDVIGTRSVVPLAEGASEVKSEMEDNIPIPYYPGRDALWVGHGVARREVDEREIVHPLAIGSEAYYRYATGDSVSYDLPDGSTIRLREIRIEAREPRWNLIVGSFWFDVASAQLVRAAYRLSIPMDIVLVAQQDGDDDIPRWLRPMTANISGITIEYALHRGRWWLPRMQYAEGQAQVSVMRVPFRLEQNFRYASVNGIDTLPAFPIVAGTPLADSVALDDSLGRVRHRRIETDDATIARSRGPGGMQVITRTPTDTIALANAPELPGSIYDPGEELFSRGDAEELMKELDFGLQAGWNPQAPVLLLPPGSGLLRYNRVEGLSAGVGIEQRFGRGYMGAATIRLGTADLEPNAELVAMRGSGRDSLGIGAYRRLAVANDWGDPLGFGPSLSSFLFARDQGLYYRTGGAELRGIRQREGALLWRVFAERQWRANVETQISLPKLFNDTRFIPNIAANRADLLGASMRYNRTLGLDPRGWRALTDLRVEGAVGDFEFGRAMADVTVSHSITSRLDGALTGSGGASAGDVPVQRLWYIGGGHTVRGHQIGTMAGNAFWMGRAELGMGSVAARPVIFYDVGWAGDRSSFDSPGVPLQGAGVGASFLDGVLRFDLAKGIRPVSGWRAEFYVEARF